MDEETPREPFDPAVLAAAERLRRYRSRFPYHPSPIEPEFLEHAQQASRVAHAVFADPDSDSVRDGLPTDVSNADMLDAIVLLDSVRNSANVVEQVLIEKLKDRGVTWEQIGAHLGKGANAAQQRYRRVGGKSTWPTRRPQTSQPDP